MTKDAWWRWGWDLTVGLRVKKGVMTRWGTRVPLLTVILFGGLLLDGCVAEPVPPPTVSATGGQSVNSSATSTVVPSSSGSSAATGLASSWDERIEQLLGVYGVSTFEKDVLSDHIVTVDEYREAQGLFVGCMAGLEWTVVVTDTGYEMTSTTRSSTTGVDPGDVQQCMRGTLGYVEPVYLGMIDDPHGLGWAGLVRVCYAARHVPDGEGLSDPEFASMIDDPQYRPSSPDAAVCYWDSTGALGIGADVAETLEVNKHSR